jgi:hypothetical protein
MENITFASFIERSARSRARFKWRGFMACIMGIGSRLAIGSSLPEFLPDGNPHKIPLDGTYQGMSTPLSYALFHDGNDYQTTVGTGTGEPQRSLREEETIHRTGVPFWKRGRQALPADIWKETGPIWPGLSGTI